MCDSVLFGDDAHCFVIHKAPDDILYVHSDCFACQHLENQEDASTGCGEELDEGITTQDEDGNEMQVQAVFLDRDDLPRCPGHVDKHNVTYPSFDPETQAEEAAEFYTFVSLFLYCSS